MLSLLTKAAEFRSGACEPGRGLRARQRQYKDRNKKIDNVQSIVPALLQLFKPVLRYSVLVSQIRTDLR